MAARRNSTADAVRRSAAATEPVPAFHVAAQQEIADLKAALESARKSAQFHEHDANNVRGHLGEALNANDQLREQNERLLFDLADAAREVRRREEEEGVGVIAHELVDLRRRLRATVFARSKFELRLASAEEALLGLAYRLGGQEIDSLDDAASAEAQADAEDEVPLT